MTLKNIDIRAQNEHPERDNTAEGLQKLEAMVPTEHKLAALKHSVEQQNLPEITPELQEMERLGRGSIMTAMQDAGVYMPLETFLAHFAKHPEDPVTLRVLGRVVQNETTTVDIITKKLSSIWEKTKEFSSHTSTNFMQNMNIGAGAQAAGLIALFHFGSQRWAKDTPGPVQGMTKMATWVMGAGAVGGLLNVDTSAVIDSMKPVLGAFGRMAFEGVTAVPELLWEATGVISGQPIGTVGKAMVGTVGDKLDAIAGKGTGKKFKEDMNRMGGQLFADETPKTQRKEDIAMMLRLLPEEPMTPLRSALQKMEAFQTDPSKMQPFTSEEKQAIARHGAELREWKKTASGSFHDHAGNFRTNVDDPYKKMAGLPQDAQNTPIVAETYLHAMLADALRHDPEYLQLAAKADKDLQHDGRISTPQSFSAEDLKKLNPDDWQRMALSVEKTTEHGINRQKLGHGIEYGSIARPLIFGVVMMSMLTKMLAAANRSDNFLGKVLNKKEKEPDAKKPTPEEKPLSPKVTRGLSKEITKYGNYSALSSRQMRNFIGTLRKQDIITKSEESMLRSQYTSEPERKAFLTRLKGSLDGQKEHHAWDAVSDKKAIKNDIMTLLAGKNLDDAAMKMRSSVWDLWETLRMKKVDGSDKSISKLFTLRYQGAPTTETIRLENMEMKQSMLPKMLSGVFKSGETRTIRATSELDKTTGEAIMGYGKDGAPTLTWAGKTYTIENIE